MTGSAAIGDMADRLELDAVILHECSVRRGEPVNLEPGQVSNQVDISSSYDDERLAYFINATHQFDNEEGQRIVDIDATFVVIYTVLEGNELGEDQIEIFARKALMVTVGPFLREFLATMTNRLAMPPFLMPLVRHGGASGVSSYRNVAEAAD